MESLKPPQAILFDWDGTLVDTLPLLLKAHNHVRELNGLSLWTQAEFMVAIKHSSKELYPAIYGDDATKALETLYEFVMAHHLEHLKLLADAEALVRFIHVRNIPMGVVSNKRQQVIDREIDFLGWRPMFYCVFGSGVAKRDKPAGDPVTLALQRGPTPLSAANVWFVGDTVSDLSAAKEAGCPAVFLTHGEDKSALINEYNPALVVKNCTQIIDTLKRFDLAAVAN